MRGNCRPRHRRGSRDRRRPPAGTHALRAASRAGGGEHRRTAIRPAKKTNAACSRHRRAPRAIRPPQRHLYEAGVRADRAVPDAALRTKTRASRNYPGKPPESLRRQGDGPSHHRGAATVPRSHAGRQRPGKDPIRRGWPVEFRLKHQPSRPGKVMASWRKAARWKQARRTRQRQIESCALGPHSRSSCHKNEKAAARRRPRYRSEGEMLS